MHALDLGHQTKAVATHQYSRIQKQELRAVTALKTKESQC